MRTTSLFVALCLCGTIVAQTSPCAPAAQEPEKKPKHKIVTSFWPAVSAASGTGPLTAKQKFELFGYNTVNPFPIVAAAAEAGISQAIDSNSGYGQGAEGYGKRFGAAYADKASTQFFGTFFYPAILRQDPRYFRRANGSSGARTLYAISRVFVTRTDSGHNAPNVSFWLASGSAAALSNTYYPAGSRSAGDAAERFGIAFASQAGFNLMKEFWPDVKRKLFKKSDRS